LRQLVARMGENAALAGGIGEGIGRVIDAKLLVD
jgi:hypothetical protein